MLYKQQELDTAYATSRLMSRVTIRLNLNKADLCKWKISDTKRDHAEMLLDFNDRVSAAYFKRRKRTLHGSQTRPINSANRAISEIINKNRNEAKSTVIEAFLCGRRWAIVRP